MKVHTRIFGTLDRHFPAEIESKYYKPKHRPKTIHIYTCMNNIPCVGHSNFDIPICQKQIAWISLSQDIMDIWRGDQHVCVLPDILISWK